MTVQIQQVQNVNVGQIIAASEYANTPNADRLLSHCVSLSDYVWLGMVDESPACVWGLIPPSLMSNRAYLWLMTTKLVDEHQFIFVRHSQRIIKEMLTQYPLIVGHVKAGEERSQRWLRWLGARFVGREGNRIVFEIGQANG